MRPGYLKRSIQRVNLYRAVFPLAFLVLLIVIALNSTVLNCLFPSKIKNSPDPSALYAQDTPYIEMTSGKLYYTGYDYFKGKKVMGHYYFSLEDGKCRIYLFSTDFLPGDVASTIEDLSFEARIIKADGNFDDLMTLMARDLNWTYEGMTSCTPPYIISQLDYGIVPSLMIAVFLYFSFAFSLGHLIILIFNMIRPEYALTFVSLGHRKARKELIMKAADEFEDNLHFETENMYLTDHFLIYVSHYNIAIIPYSYMAWAYKYSRLHRYIFFGSLTYSLKVITKNKVRLTFHRKSKKAADDILSYLEEINPNMLIGYTQENYENSKHIMSSIFLYFFK